MMEFTDIMTNKQYVMPLDSLDSRFMKQYVEKSGDKEKVLWSNSVHVEPEFYKVAIVSEEIPKNDSYIEEYNSYPCYICNIDVPQKFYKQHIKSKIHQNYKKLADKFLENVSKQLNIDLDTISNGAENDTFYCETCCKVVDVKYKRRHEESYYHLKCIEKEDLITKFLAMYNRNNYQHYVESPNDSYDNRSASATYNAVNTSPGKDSTHNVDNNANVTGTGKKYKEHITAEKSQDSKSQIVNTKNDANVQTEEQKLIEYDKQFSDLNETQVTCLVCSVVVPNNDRNIIEHVEGTNHSGVMNMLLNDNYIQKVSLKQYYCHLCDCSFGNFLNHINKAKKHKLALGNGISKSLIREYVYDDPNNKNSVAIHCRQQYKNELERNRIIRNENSSFYCQVCSLFLTKISEIYHMFGERHRTAFEDLTFI